MKLLSIFQKPHVFLPFVFLLALILRISFLNMVPTGITNDELEFVLNAKSIFFTGHDIKGVWSPLTLKPITGEFPQAELPHLLISPFIGIFPLSLFFAKLPYALVNSGLVVILSLIILKILGKKEAIIVGIVAACNPWGIFFGRTAYEAPLAIFFYFLAFLILLYAKKWKILFAFIPLFLGFFCYMGTKMIFLPFSALILYYSWRAISNKKYTKQYLLVFLLCIVTFLFFLISLKTSSTQERLSELATPFTPAISKQVNDERRLSVITPLSSLYSNKIIVFGKEITEKYFRVFSPEILFLHGEGRSTFSVWTHGYFYYIDIVFLIFGIYGLFKRNKRFFYFLLCATLIAPIPTILSTSSSGFAALRSVLLFPLLMIWIGIGISEFISLRHFRNYRIFIIAAIIITYLLLFINFIYIYFFRNPIYNSEAFSLSNRVLSEYIMLSSQNQRVIILSNAPATLFKQYLFYSDGYTSKTQNSIKQTLLQKRYRIGNVTFMTCNSPILSHKDTVIIAEADNECEQKMPKTQRILKISQLGDGRSLFKISNDAVCNDYKLKKFRPAMYFSDFDINSLSLQRFCQVYIHK